LGGKSLQARDSIHQPINPLTHAKGHLMNNIVYIVGVVVIVVALLSFFGLR
jgi:hypothetical protein